MDAERQREIASKGGKASALGNTSNRGFASMDAGKQREISRKGDRQPTVTGTGWKNWVTITATGSWNRRNKVLIWSAGAKSFP